MLGASAQPPSSPHRPEEQPVSLPPPRTVPVRTHLRGYKNTPCPGQWGGAQWTGAALTAGHLWGNARLLLGGGARRETGCERCLLKTGGPSPLGSLGVDGGNLLARQVSLVGSDPFC